MSATIELNYGKETIPWTVGNAECRGTLAPIPQPESADIETLLTAALEQPIDSDSLATRARDARSAAILISGKDRITGAPHYLPRIVRTLEESGMRRDKISVIMATGTHVPFSDEDRAFILGDTFPADIPIHAHACRDESTLTEIGTTTRGNRVRVNRRAYESDIKILTGRITHHYFAGFTAGRKSVLPGICAFSTIVKNHRMVLGDAGEIVHPHTRNGVLETNPVHEEMMEAAALFNPTFCVNTVLDTAHKVTHVFGGHYITAHRAGCEVVRELFEAPVTHPVDVVIASCGGYPYDCSFMQAIKTLMNMHTAVRDGGCLILAAECREGIKKEFLEWPQTNSLEELADLARANYNLTGHNTVLIRSILKRIRVVLLSRCPREEVERMGMIAADTPEAAWQSACAVAGSATPSFYIVPHGNVTVASIPQNETP